MKRKKPASYRAVEFFAIDRAENPIGAQPLEYRLRPTVSGDDIFAIIFMECGE